MGHFFEERAADVFARLVAVDVLLTELYVLERGAAQTVQGVGEEELALLRDSQNRLLTSSVFQTYILDLQNSFFW